MIVFDMEVFAYNWLLCAIDLNDGTRYIIEDNVPQLREFYKKYENDLWIGYNVKNYDVFVVRAILSGYNPKLMNDWIIKQHKSGWRFDGLGDYPINVYDCMIMGKSLKQLESYMGVNIHETEVDFDILRPLTDSEKELNRAYCMSDVENTIRILEHNFTEFEASLGLCKLAGVGIENMSKTKAQLSAKILGATQLTPNEWAEEWDYTFNDCVSNYDYKHKDIIKFFEELRNEKNPNASFEIDLYGVPHTFALGGVHGAIPNYIYTPTEDEYILHIDVASYYPHIMTEWGYLTRAIPTIQQFRDIMDLRLKYKKEKNPLQAVLKIAINGTYGQSGAGKKLDDGKYRVLSPMYDPKRMREVCINGQLMLLQLIEDLSEHCTQFKLIQLTQWLN